MQGSYILKENILVGSGAAAIINRVGVKVIPPGIPVAQVIAIQRDDPVPGEIGLLIAGDQFQFHRLVGLQGLADQVQGILPGATAQPVAIATDTAIAPVDSERLPGPRLTAPLDG